jgi:hypothetical protein
MYYTGINPYSMEKIPVARKKEQKLAQRKFFFWYKNEYRNDVMAELRKSNRQDLIDKLFGKTTTTKKFNPKKRKRK